MYISSFSDLINIFMSVYFYYSFFRIPTHGLRETTSVVVMALRSAVVCVVACLCVLGTSNRVALIQSSTWYHLHSGVRIVHICWKFKSRGEQYR